MRIKLAVIFLLVLSIQTASAQDKPSPAAKLKDQVTQRARPDDWLKSLRESSGGNWNEVDTVSAPMAQILQVANDAISDHSNSTKDTDCKRAAARLGFAVTFDAYSTVGLQGLLSALGEAMVQIVFLHANKVSEAVSGGAAAAEGLFKKFEELLKQGREKAQEYVNEQLAKGRPEVFVSNVTKGKCQVVTVSIWDQAAGTYQVWVYGDCKCTRQQNDTLRGTSSLSTFAIRMEGKVSVGIDFDKRSPVLNVAAPRELSVEANCDACKEDAAATTPVPEATPKEKVDYCSLKRPCPECESIYDQIIAGCKRLTEIDNELRKLSGNKFGYENRKAYIQKQVAQLEKQGAAAANELKARKEELKDTERQLKSFKFESYALEFEQTEINWNLKKLTEQLKVCEKTQCGKGTKTLDPCLIGVWKSSLVNFLQGSPMLFSGITLSIRGDGVIALEYNQARHKADISGFTIWDGTAEGHITTANGTATVTTDKSNVTITHQLPNGVTNTGQLRGLGPASPGMPPTRTYTCDATTLTYQNTLYLYTFKRFGIAPR